MGTLVSLLLVLHCYLVSTWDKDRVPTCTGRKKRKTGPPAQFIRFLLSEGEFFQEFFFLLRERFVFLNIYSSI